MDKLTLSPLTSGYAMTSPTEVGYVPLRGGAGAFYADFEGGYPLVDLNWILPQSDFDDWMEFFDDHTGEGSEAFLIDLLLESPILDEYATYFIPGSISVSPVQGTELLAVSCQAHVVPPEEDADYDSSIVDLFEAAGGADLDDYLDLLSALVEASPGPSE